MIQTYTVLNLKRGDYVAEIHATADGFALSWSDGVANYWTEDFPTLATALVRLAALDYCVSSDRGFVSDPLPFAASARDFLESQTAPAGSE